MRSVWSVQTSSLECYLTGLLTPTCWGCWLPGLFAQKRSQKMSCDMFHAGQAAPRVIQVERDSPLDRRFSWVVRKHQPSKAPSSECKVLPPVNTIAYTQPWLFSGFCLPFYGCRVPWCFLPVFLVFGSKVWWSLWCWNQHMGAGGYLVNVHRVTLVCLWPGMAALGLSYHPSSLQQMNWRQIVTGDFSREKVFNEYLKGHNPMDCVWCHVAVSRFSLLQKLDWFLGPG